MSTRELERVEVMGRVAKSGLKLVDAAAMLLLRVSAFDDPDWIFELKLDGFRALAVVESGRAQLISRNGHPFASFADLTKDIATAIHDTETVLDGEIVCVDKKGKPQFRDLLFRRGEPCFFVFDLLFCDGKDWRREALMDRKQELRRLLSRVPADSRIKYVDHVDGTAPYFSECASWTWRVSLPSGSQAHTSQIVKTALGSRFVIGNNRTWRAVRSCSSVNGTRNQFQAGILAS